MVYAKPCNDVFFSYIKATALLSGAKVYHGNFSGLSFGSIKILIWERQFSSFILCCGVVERFFLNNGQNSNIIFGHLLDVRVFLFVKHGVNVGTTFFVFQNLQNKNEHFLYLLDCRRFCTSLCAL